MNTAIRRFVEHEFVAIDVALSGNRETQSGLNLTRPRIYGLLARPSMSRSVALISDVANSEFGSVPKDNQEQIDRKGSE